ncbi:hypothetical protein OCA20_10565 [Bacillus cereus]|nr:hypothetical protein [Bacillus cereus]
MIQTVVVRSSGVGPLQEKINDALKELSTASVEIVDIKLSSACSPQSYNHVAMIIYKTVE